MIGITRLAISAPHSSTEIADFGQIRTVANGELYNHQELRRRLPVSSRPNSRVDTALIPALFHEFKEQWVDHAQGMYAVAIYDGRNQSLHLFRDPVGKKPLFYAIHKDILFFASEIKALISAGALKPKVDRRAASQALIRGFLDDSTAFVEGAHVLPPGGHLVANRKGVEVTQRLPWDHCVDDDLTLNADALFEMWRTAVERRAHVEVPAVTCLSGGMDSTLVASEARLPTVSLAMPEGDESRRAAQIARTLKRQQTTTPAMPMTKAMLRRALWHLEVPDSSAVWGTAGGLLSLAHFLGQSGIKVALSGEGADELFLGYPWQRVALAHKKLWKLPQRDATNLALPHAQQRFGLAKLEPQGKHLRAFELWRHACMRVIAPQLATHLLALLPEAQAARVDAHESLPSSPHLSRRLQREAIEHDMLTLPVLHADRLMMAFGVETRMPFLDLDLVCAALRMPESKLVERRYEKPIVRSWYRERLKRTPPAKHGFRGAYRPETPEVISWANTLAREGCAIVEGSGLRTLARRARSEDSSVIEALWRGIVVEEMARVLERSTPPELG